MGKRLIHAVAGAGKTTTILEGLRQDRRSLILTYTNQNLHSLEEGIRKRYGGVIPQFVEVKTYFSFLYSFCLRPYLSYKFKDHGLVYGPVPKQAQRQPKTSIKHYMSSNRYLYAPRAAKLVRETEVLAKVRESLTKHFDCLYVDEVQDFASNDFNLLLDLAEADIDILYVGDFHQHTFDTSRDGNTRSTLHSKGAAAYLQEFKNAGFKLDTTSLARSRRCSKSVCEFIFKTLEIEIESIREDATEVVFTTDPKEIQRIYHDPMIVKLFLKEHVDYGCFSNNWGNSKGIDSYGDVCVVLNPKTNSALSKGKGKELKQMTRNKLYVACSRARGKLYLVDQNELRQFRQHKP